MMLDSSLRFFFSLMPFRLTIILLVFVLICVQDVCTAHPLEQASLQCPAYSPTETAAPRFQNTTVTVQRPPTTEIGDTVPGTKGVRFSM